MKKVLPHNCPLCQTQGPCRSLSYTGIGARFHHKSSLAVAVHKAGFEVRGRCLLWGSAGPRFQDYRPRLVRRNPRTSNPANTGRSCTLIGARIQPHSVRNFHQSSLPVGMVIRRAVSGAKPVVIRRAVESENRGWGTGVLGP